ncbi:MAG TPA: hypothetical protein PLY73_05150 [Candidatus Ozemobacteraceae bacterium]|nr:hypothetical protein [Candidatus Ozemobacteraceae bacterium]
MANIGQNELKRLLEKEKGVSGAVTADNPFALTDLQFGEILRIRNRAFRLVLDLRAKKCHDILFRHEGRSPSKNSAAALHPGLCIDPAIPQVAFGTSKTRNKPMADGTVFLVRHQDAPFLNRDTAFLLRYRIPVCWWDIDHEKPSGVLPDELKRRLATLLGVTP